MSFNSVLTSRWYGDIRRGGCLTGTGFPGDFGDAIKTLVDHAFPTLEPAANEVIALNHYLSHLSNPQMEFAVKQREP